MVKVTSERLPDAQIVLNIEVEPDVVRKATERAYQSISSRVNVPGFRRGKAPRHLVERMIGGAEAVRQEGLERAIPEAYRQALEETGIQPIDQPSIEVVTSDPLVLKATVAVEPIVTLGDYRSIRLARVAVDVPYERINETIERLREQHTEWVPVQRPAQAGDRVTADVLGTVGSAPTLYDPQGQPILQTEGRETLMDSKNAEFELDPASTAPVPGFHEQLVGVASGAEKRFVLSLPADWPNEAQRSQTVLFQVTMQDVKEAKPPALDDEFAQRIDPEYATLDALREDIRERLRAQLEHEAEHHYEDSVIGEAVARSTVEVPPALVRREVDRLVQNFERSLARQRISLDQYLRMTSKDAEALRDELRPQAEANLRSFLVLRDLGRAEGVTVSPDDVDAEIARVSSLMGSDPKAARQILERPEEREDIRASLWHRNVVTFLKDIASGSVELADPGVEAADGESADAEAASVDGESADGGAAAVDGESADGGAAAVDGESADGGAEPPAQPADEASPPSKG